MGKGDALRVVQHRLGQALHSGREGRAEQQVLSLGRQQRQHALQLFGKTKVEQAVGFVEHQVLHLPQIQGVVVHQIEQAARRGHHHVSTAAQAHHLGVDRHATKHRPHFDGLRQWPRQIAQHIAHLCGELACGHEHQHLGDAFLRRIVTRCRCSHEQLQHREHIGCCFARARLGRGQNIAAIEHGANGLRLHRCR